MTNRISPQESLFIYYAKALGILFVVMGHYTWPTFLPNPYIFHMPLFFLIGGLLVKPVRNWKIWWGKFFQKYILYYLFWYFVLATCALIMNYLLGTALNTPLDRIFSPGRLVKLLMLRTQSNMLFRIAWFLVAYAIAMSIFQATLTFLQSKKINNLRIVIPGIGLIVGFLSVELLAPYYNENEIPIYNLLCQVGFGFTFISIGFSLQNNFQHFKNVPLIFLCLSIFFIFVRNDTFHPLVMSLSNYPDHFFIHLCSAMCGCFIVLAFSYILSLATKINLLVLLGRSSKDIFTLHLLSLVAVDLFLSNLGLFSTGKINTINHFMSMKAFPFYITTGVFLPILFAKLLRKVGLGIFTN